MTAFQMACTCRHCAGPLTIINQAQPSTGESVAVLECGACRRAWTLRMQLVAELRPRSVERARRRVGVGA